MVARALRCTVVVTLLSCALAAHPRADGPGPAAPSIPAETGSSPGLGVNPAELNYVVSHPLLMFSTLKKAVYVGKERDGDSGQSFKVRLELTASDTSETIAGVRVTAIDATDYADGEVVERARKFYAQHSSGAVYCIAEHIDDYEDG